MSLRQTPPNLKNKTKTKKLLVINSFAYCFDKIPDLFCRKQKKAFHSLPDFALYLGSDHLIFMRWGGGMGWGEAAGGGGREDYNDPGIVFFRN